MSYRLTPINIACALIAGGELLILVYPEVIRKEHYGYQHVFLVPVLLCGLLLDLLFQKLIKRYGWLLVFEALLLVVVFALNGRP